MKRLFTGMAAAVAVCALVGSAAAITNGGPDGTGHAEVGALLAQQPFSDGTWEECTGTLIAPRIFLTAEHCDLGVDRVEVTFASTFDRATSTTYWGTWHGDPAYKKTSGNPYDIAVVVLDQAATGHPPEQDGRA